MHVPHWVILLGMTVTGAGVATGQTYPHKPIRIVTVAPGGGLDVEARLVAIGLTANLGQQVIVDNRAGGSGMIAAQVVVNAPADGYTLLYHSSAIWLMPFLRSNVQYDALRDLSPITLTTTAPMLLVVNSALPVSSVKDLIALAKARPGELNYGSGGFGGPNHLSPELFKAMAGVNIVQIPYKGAAAALNGLIGGEFQVMFPGVASGMPYVKSGRLRALAITAAQPSPLAPGLPTLAASGLPGYESVYFAALFAPAKTRRLIVDRLNQEIVRVLNTPDVKERLFNAGFEVVGSSPDQLVVVVKSEMAKWGKVIKDAGIRAE